MPTKWAPNNRTASTLGRFRVVVHVPGAKAQDVTFLRNVPISVDSYSTADPFGYSTAVISFPQITIIDDIGSGELWFLQDYVDVTIYITDQNGNDTATVWEGFIASMDWNQDDQGSTFQVQCKGAVFQVDNYVEKPFFPPRPWAYENLIKRCFDHGNRPDLRTGPLQIEWPAGWSKVAPNPTTYEFDYMRPYGVTPGQKVTGFYGRSTGAWDKSLTSYIQGMLQVMLDEQGQQWTIRCDPGRNPVLYLREMFNITPDHVMFAGQIGSTIQVTRDLTQFANVVYGSGTDTDGTVWSRQQVSSDGLVTTYEPLSWDAEVWPTVQNPRLNLHKMTVETNVRFDNGFDERQAIDASRLMLRRDMDPGLAGTITIKTDLASGSRFLMKAGQTILVKYLLGSGAGGILFHIAQVDIDINEGTATLKVDTKFRDLLTLEEVLVRTRDPLTPVALLQIGKRSILVQDQMAPWDYSRGAGFIPEKSLNFFHGKPHTSQFPYSTWAQRYPPHKYPQYYVEVHAHAKSSDARWTTGVMVRLSEKGDIRLTQIAAYDRNGFLAPCIFHFSIYSSNVGVDSMPFDANGHSPFVPNAFQDTSQYGLPVTDSTDGSPGWTKFAQQALIMGWGNGSQPAGYSPGMKSRGDDPTGLLIDEQVWSYDMTHNPDFLQNAKYAGSEPAIGITAYGVFYAEYHEPVYFLGRLYKKEPAT